MALNTDAKFEGKLTLAFKNDMTNFSPAHLKDSKFGRLRDSFIQSRKCMTMKKDAKLEEELTCRFKTDMRTLMNFDPSTRISQNFALLWDLFDQSI